MPSLTIGDFVSEAFKEPTNEEIVLAARRYLYRMLTAPPEKSVHFNPKDIADIAQWVLNMQADYFKD